MKIVINEKGKKHINRWIEWLLYMTGYALILIAVSMIFKKTIYIDSEYFGLWGLVAAVCIYGLNKTIKPILFWLTLPITGLTLGLFYPFLNLFILNIVDTILGSKFQIVGLFMGALVAVFISITNILLDEVVIKPIIKRRDN